MQRPIISVLTEKVNGGGGSRSEFSHLAITGQNQDNYRTHLPQTQTNQGSPDHDLNCPKDNIGTSQGHNQDIKRHEKNVKSMYDQNAPNQLSCDLQILIEAWPDLPPDVRAAIVVMVKATKSKE